MKTLLVGLALGLAVCAACNKGLPSTGVAECDDYIAKFQVCLEKMPAAVRGAQEAALRGSIDGWRTAASTPQGKAQAAQACQMASGAMASNPMCK